MGQLKFVERLFTRFMQNPLTVRGATRIIVLVTGASVVIGGVMIRLLDSKEFPNIWVGMWWAVQTVTTVGYGDVTPQRLWGRIVGAAIMLEAIAFVAIVTAAITSSFVERARVERLAVDRRSSEEGSLMPGEPVVEQLANQLADIQARLDQIQRVLESDGSARGAAGKPTGAG